MHGMLLFLPESVAVGESQSLRTEAYPLRCLHASDDAVRLHSRSNKGFFRGNKRLFFPTVGIDSRCKRKVGAGIGATPTWGYCVCCYQNRRNSPPKVSENFKININIQSHRFI